jgi:Protein-L-isoaspartate(D-aspartate) O-methyltransferase (PCMT)
MPDYVRLRDRMVDIQIERRGVRDRHVLDAMRHVPREAFVAPGFEEFAYEDGPLPIGEGQTISQPYIVALMIQAAEVAPGNPLAAGVVVDLHKPGLSGIPIRLPRRRLISARYLLISMNTNFPAGQRLVSKNAWTTI